MICNCSSYGCKICKPPYKYAHTSSCKCDGCDMSEAYKVLYEDAKERTKLLIKSLEKKDK